MGRAKRKREGRRKKTRASFQHLMRAAVNELQGQVPRSFKGRVYAAVLTTVTEDDTEMQ